MLERFTNSEQVRDVVTHQFQFLLMFFNSIFLFFILINDVVLVMIKYLSIWFVLNRILWSKLTIRTAGTLFL